MEIPREGRAVTQSRTAIRLSALAVTLGLLLTVVPRAIQVQAGGMQPGGSIRKIIFFTIGGTRAIPLISAPPTLAATTATPTATVRTRTALPIRSAFPP